MDKRVGSLDSLWILNVESHLEVKFYMYKWIKTAAGMRMRRAPYIPAPCSPRRCTDHRPCLALSSSITADHYHTTTPRFTPHTRLVVLFSESLSVSNSQAVGELKDIITAEGNNGGSGLADRFVRAPLARSAQSGRLPPPRLAQLQYQYAVPTQTEFILS